MKRIFNRHPTELNHRNLRHAENAAKHHIEQSKKKPGKEFVSTINSTIKSKAMFDKIKKINNKFTMKQTILQQQNQVVLEHTQVWFYTSKGKEFPQARVALHLMGQ